VFRAILLRIVKTEVLILPLDLYINKRVAETEKRFKARRIISISQAVVSIVVKLIIN
jgi:hypothetical protein